MTAPTRIVCFILLMLVPTSALPDDMLFLVRDGSRIVGSLQPCERQGTLAIQTDVLSEPVLVPSDQLLLGSIADDQTDRQTITPASSAFHLTDDSWLVGELEAIDNEGIKIRTDSIGIVSFSIDELVRMIPADELPRRLATLANSCWRFKGRVGWKFNGRQLKADVTVASVVLDWQLPQRFRMVVKARSSGNPDFEWTLGDRSVNQAGQGRAGVDRKGGSLSRLPTERFVTRMEWFGDDITLVRSDPSVSDAEAIQESLGKLDVELFCDQRQGILVAFSQGREVARAQLTDSDPKQRDQLTLIHRGDAVTVEQLDLFQWDGKIPKSGDRERPMIRWQDGRTVDFELARLIETDAANDLIALQTGNPVVRTASVELQFVDGTRLMGTLAGREQDKMVLVASGGRRFRFDPERVTAIRIDRDSYSDDAEKQGREGRSWLIDGQTRLSGDWDVDDQSSGLTWRRRGQSVEAKVIAKPGVSIESPSRSARATMQSFVGMELTSGDRSAGRLSRWSGDRTMFRSVFAAEVTVSNDKVSRLTLRKHRPVDPAELNWVLQLPRRKSQQAPSHLIVSAGGDLLRGEIASIDAKQALVEIRDRVRPIAVERIAEIIVPANRPRQTDSIAYQIETADGSRLGFSSISGDESVVLAEHPVFGACSIPRAEIKRIELNSHRSPPRVPEWIPMPKPR